MTIQIIHYLLCYIFCFLTVLAYLKKFAAKYFVKAVTKHFNIYVRARIAKYTTLEEMTLEEAFWFPQFVKLSNMLNDIERKKHND